MVPWPIHQLEPNLQSINHFYTCHRLEANSSLCFFLKRNKNCWINDLFTWIILLSLSNTTNTTNTINATITNAGSNLPDILSLISFSRFLSISLYLNLYLYLYHCISRVFSLSLSCVLALCIPLSLSVSFSLSLFI